MSSLTSEEEVSKVELEVQNLKDELTMFQEAVTVEESSKKIMEYCEGDKDGVDPMSVKSTEPNKWHKAGGGGGCAIL